MRVQMHPWQPSTRCDRDRKNSQTEKKGTQSLWGGGAGEHRIIHSFNEMNIIIIVINVIIFYYY